MSAPAQWSDLSTRSASTLVMASLAIGAIWAGGTAFALFIAVICGVVLWELVRMLAPVPRRRALALGALGAVCSFIDTLAPIPVALLLLLAPALLGWAWLGRGGKARVFACFAVMILAAGLGLVVMRGSFGVVWLSWLVLTVAATDVAGYFVGKSLGGPKFWPALSPKKTWSGTAGGWAAAGAVGAAFTAWLPGGGWLVALSMAAAFSSQMGDIAQSAVKRRAGVKDSSTLIPGHGGLFDRMDGMLGGALLVLVVMLLTGYPPELP